MQPYCTAKCESASMLTPTELKAAFGRKTDYSTSVYCLQHFNAFKSGPGTLIYALSQRAESAQSSVPGSSERERLEMIRMYRAERNER